MEREGFWGQAGHPPGNVVTFCLTLRHSFQSMIKGAQRDHTFFLFFFFWITCKVNPPSIHFFSCYHLMLISAWFPASLLLTLTYYLKRLCTSLLASISACIFSNNEYHTSFTPTSDYHLYATHCASEHVAEACSGVFFPAALSVKIPATVTLQVSSWIIMF